MFQWDDNDQVKMGFFELFVVYCTHILLDLLNTYPRSSK